MPNRTRGALRPLLVLLVCGGLLLLGGSAWAQGGFACPEPGALILPELLGGELQDALRTAYRPPVGLSYGDARDVMFGIVDNEGGRVSGVYTGFTVSVSPSSSNPRGDAFDAGLNTEHTWPQSKGADSVPMRADLHHLFPSDINANNARGSFPFDEINDDETDLWYRLLEVTPNPAAETLDEYSELDRAFPGTGYDGRWEPRESQKGNVARAMFYFYTVYRNEANAADPSFFGVQLNDLRAWHHADPVDEQEYERTCAIAPHQANRVNPFVIDPTLVDRAYFPETPVRLARFTAQPTASGVLLEWGTIAEEDHLGFDLIRAVGVRETRIAVGVPAEAGGAGLGPRGRNYRFLDRTGNPGRLVVYWLEAVSRVGVRDRFGPREVRFPSLAPGLLLSPNPALAGEPISVQVGGADTLVAEFFDLSGRRVAVRRSGTGDHGELIWNGRLDDGRAVPPGVYFVRVQASGRRFTARLVVLR